MNDEEHGDCIIHDISTTNQCIYCNDYICEKCTIYICYCSLYHVYLQCDIAANKMKDVYARIFKYKVKNDRHTVWGNIIMDDQKLIHNNIQSINEKLKNFSYFELKKFVINDLAKIVSNYL